jgi:hypothetical protein
VGDTGARLLVQGVPSCIVRGHPAQSPKGRLQVAENLQVGPVDITMDDVERRRGSGHGLDQRGKRARLQLIALTPIAVRDARQ